MSSFADHFSASAGAYAAFRPSYPAPLFQWLAHQAPSRDAAWDCATGSGQAARGLADHFGLVVASDASAAQVAHAERHPRVRYVVMPAERVALAPGSMSLVTVAQALHWFDRPRFHAEARRVLRPGGLLAVWRYGLTHIDADVDRVIHRFYSETVGPWWPPERAIVDAGYATLSFPFDELHVPTFQMQASWTRAQLAGYLGTWSAVNRYRAAHGVDPIPALLAELAPHWTDDDAARLVRWPIEVRAGRV